jgi:hypothetical protein
MHEGMTARLQDRASARLIIIFPIIFPYCLYFNNIAKNFETVKTEI